MPELSRFFGIVIRMFSEPGSPHNIAHFHAYYQDEAAVFAIDPVDLLAGGLPGDSNGLLRRGRNYIRRNCGLGSAASWQQSDAYRTIVIK